MKNDSIIGLNLCYNNRCNYCRDDCPIYKHNPMEFNSPRSKKELIMEMMRNPEIGDSASIEKIVFNCRACNRCIECCPFEINTPEILWESRPIFSGSRSIQKYLFFLIYGIRSRLKI